MTLIDRVCLMNEYPMKKTGEETDLYVSNMPNLGVCYLLHFTMTRGLQMKRAEFLPLVLAQQVRTIRCDDKRSIRNAA